MNASSPANIVARDIMIAKLVTLSPETDVFQGIETLIRHKISGAPVVDESGNLIGVFSEKSCMQVLIDAAYEGLPTNSVSAFMDSNPETIDENTSFLTIAQIFLTSRGVDCQWLREVAWWGRSVAGTSSELQRNPLPPRSNSPARCFTFLPCAR